MSAETTPVSTGKDAGWVCAFVACGQPTGESHIDGCPYQGHVMDADFPVCCKVIGHHPTCPLAPVADASLGDHDECPEHGGFICTHVIAPANRGGESA